jgi:hypothetical protein
MASKPVPGTLLKKQPKMAAPDWEQRPVPAPVLRVDIPLEAYRVLERRVQELRASVLNRAKSIAEKRGSTAKTTGNDVAEALRELAESGRLKSVKPDPGLLSGVSADCFDRLDRSLDRIRTSVIQTASSFSIEDHLDPRSNVVQLSAAVIEMAWTAVWENTPLRTAALTGGK